MARIRFSGGIVPAGDRRVWLVDDPGQEVDSSRPFPGAPVVVGPAGAARKSVDRARREARRLVAAGGPLVAAAGVDLGDDFATARLEGGGEVRREAVLAAAEVLGIDGLDRIGPRQGVLVALFGTRATKRVGAAALARMAGGSWSAVRLTVAASDLLEPEQLEAVLGLESPAGLEPVPHGTTASLADQLTTVLTPFSSKRRKALVVSLWDDVAGWQLSDAARSRARRRRFSAARRDALLAGVRRRDDAWWRDQASMAIGDEPAAARMLSWVPPPQTRKAALWRAFQECAAATVLVRTALAAEEHSVEDAVFAHLGPLAYAATAHVPDVADRVGSLHRATARGEPAGDRAWGLASGVVLASEPGGLVDHDMRIYLRAQLRHSCELGHAVLRSALDLVNASDGDVGGLSENPQLREWRALVGYSPLRDPREWWEGDDDELMLGHRLEGHAGDPAEVERVEDLLWIADLADALAAWFGHRRAEVSITYHAFVDVDPPADPPDPRLPSLESVPLAVAGAAQLVALGAATPVRPASWSALVEGLVSGSERLGLDGGLTVPADVAEWNGRELPGTELRIEVARTAQQLAEWGNYMGNCIATYATDAGRRFALVALRDGAGTMRANVSVARRGDRWNVTQARARFNDLVPEQLNVALDAWARDLGAPAAPPGPRPPAPATRPPARRGRSRLGSARDRVRRAAEELGTTIGDVAADERLGAVREAMIPVARELGWAAAGEGDWDGPFVALARPRRSGPVAAGTARALADGLPLADLWRASSVRPLAGAAASGDLARLVDLTVPPSLRVALAEPRVWRARVVDLSGRRVRIALGELLLAGDPRLDDAVLWSPDRGFLTAAMLALTAASPSQDDGRFERIPFGADGAVPGRPPSSVIDPAGPWVAAAPDAEELGASGVPVDHLLVPATWTSARGWPALWARANRRGVRVGRD